LPLVNIFDFKHELLDYTENNISISRCNY
jgi:hypothetical protein